MNRNSRLGRQREHQANERTFLAWLRTSLALIGFGLVIARFGLFLRELQSTITPQSAPFHSWFNFQILGVGLVIAGIIFIALSVWRYNRVFWQIERGNYHASRLMVWIMAGVVIILGVLSIPLVLSRQPSVPSKPSPQRSNGGKEKLAQLPSPLVRHGSHRTF